MSVLRYLSFILYDVILTENSNNNANVETCVTCGQKNIENPWTLLSKAFLIASKYLQNLPDLVIYWRSIFLFLTMIKNNGKTTRITEI